MEIVEACTATSCKTTPIRVEKPKLGAGLKGQVVEQLEALRYLGIESCPILSIVTLCTRS